MSKTNSSVRPTTADILAEIPSGCRQKRILPGLTMFAVDWVGYIAMVAGICVLPTWWLKGLCGLGLVVFIGRLAVVAHDCGHHSLTPSRWLNRVLGRLAFLPSYTPFSGWQYAHNHLHHRHLRVRGLDMVWRPWSLEEYRAASTLRRCYYRLLRSPLGFSHYWIVENWLKHHMFPASFPPKKLPSLRFDRLLVATFAVAQFGLLWLLSHWAAGFPQLQPLPWVGILLCAQVIPYVVWSYQMGLLDLVHHTHPHMAWFKNKDEWTYYQANVASTSHILLPFGGNRMLHNILEHTAHHVDPSVPLYGLLQAQTSLEAIYTKDIVVAYFSPAYVWRLLQTCQLYDFDRHCWLDFRGRTTSPPFSTAQTSE